MAPLGRAHRSVRCGGSAFDPLRAHLTLRRETGELGLSQSLQRRTLSAVPLGEHDRPGQAGGYSHQLPSVSRDHAALCRDSEGIWRIYPIRTGGTLLNGTVVERPTALNPGDALSMGGVDIYFFPDQKQARRPVRTAASPGRCGR
ncbi:MAG: FHA domain-containing protein [Oscillospiraceae bacterium]